MTHWHALGSIWAVQAGKDVYVEKPVSHNVWEGRKMVEAARKYRRIIQTGTQCRSSAGLQEAIAVDLTQAPIGIPVVKVIVPGLEGATSYEDTGYFPGARAKRMTAQ